MARVAVHEYASVVPYDLSYNISMGIKALNVPDDWQEGSIYFSNGGMTAYHVIPWDDYAIGNTEEVKQEVKKTKIYLPLKRKIRIRNKNV